MVNKDDLALKAFQFQTEMEHFFFGLTHPKYHVMLLLIVPILNSHTLFLASSRETNKNNHLALEPEAF